MCVDKRKENSPIKTLPACYNRVLKYAVFIFKVLIFGQVVLIVIIVGLNQIKITQIKYLEIVFDITQLTFLNSRHLLL